MISQSRYYYAAPPNRRQPPKTARTRRRWPLVLAALIVLAAGGAAYALTRPSPTPAATQPNTKNTTAKTTQPATQSTAPAVAAQPNACAANTAGGQLALVSIGKRHLWACDGTKQLYDSAVVTGMEMYPADLTPPGTYHIYGKYLNTVLKGRDSTGSWNDPVDYWMPWLHNQYGTYGFHDAQWRAPTDFGNISPNSTDASHGCVELPLATAKWLYNWAQIGTTVTIEA